MEEIRAQRHPVGRRSDWDTLPLVVRGEQLHWFEAGQLGNPSRLAPVVELPTRTFDLFLQEIPPSQATDLQRHMHETVHIVLEGEGYSEIGGQRWTWRAGDFIYTPPMVWHRHYNSRADQRVRMIGVENSRLLAHLRLNYRQTVGEQSYDSLPEEAREP